jgi:cobalt-precorrin 5A hydrolase
MTELGRIAIGIGCKKDCTAEEIIELVYFALEKAEILISEVAIMATAWVKNGAENVLHAAEALDLPLLVIPQEKCASVANLAQTISKKVVALHAIPSVAETAALAAAGKNPRIILPRINSSAATCAIAGSGVVEGNL